MQSGENTVAAEKADILARVCAALGGDFSGASTGWDGLAEWFVCHLEHHSGLARDPYLGRWLRATRAVQEELGRS